MFLKEKLSRTLINLTGWHTKRKIVVIESDDWGSIRMPSREVYEFCLKNGYRVDLNPYEKFDSLESENDLTELFNVLLQFKDSNNNHPVITANCCVANPDFQKIKVNDYSQYFYELVTETFKKYPNHTSSFNLWKKGLSEKIFYPQFHAREHLNVFKFMDALKSEDRDVLFGFNNNMPGMIKFHNNRWANLFVEATYFYDEESKETVLNSYLDGLDIFEKILGYKSESVIPANYIWSDDFNEHINKKGVRIIQGQRKYKVPDTATNKHRYKSVYLGKKNKLNQIYLVRNCSFEPSLTNNNDEHIKCLNEISIAFKLNKPAVISSHRINFIGSIDPANQKENLESFRLLLSSILRKWPEAEFLNSVELGNLILSKNTN